ncbi:MAG: GC-type dockerin domain-anchored protein [Planctomycetota bacterium]
MRQKVCAGLGAAVAFGSAASAQSINDYSLARTFDLPPSWNGTADFDNTVLFDALPDGRLLIVNGPTVSVETGVGTGVFSSIGDYTPTAPAFGPGFIRVSPDGARVAIGSSGGGSVSLASTTAPTPGTTEVFAASDFAGAWIDDTSLALSNVNGVDVLNTSSGAVSNIVTNVGGASAGIAFDAGGNLYTGNGFDFVPGGSDTGAIKAFEASAWQSALAGGSVIDFENSGVEVADVLSAGTLGFDSSGNFFVGGADFFSGSGDFGYAALTDADAVAARLDDPVGVALIDAGSDPSILRMFDSPQAFIDAQSPPAWTYNEVTGELYLSFFGQSEVFVYQASDAWADRVVSYDQGIGAASGFTDPSTALGEPTRITSPSSSFGGATTPFQGAFGTSELVSIGEGGHLTVEFDEPVRDELGNPFGVDLLVFGNAFYLDTDFPNGVAGGLFAEGGAISVSADGITFFDVPNAIADGAFPTNGFLDPTGPLTTGGQQVTGTIESDFTLPVDPSFNPTGLPFADLLAGYDGSGGGVGIDIGELGLSEISFVRIDNPVGAGGSPEIDGLSDVAARPCSVADLAFPLGIVDLTDVDAFIAAFVAGDPAADVAFPFDVVDLSDVDAFIAAFLAGCP